MAKIYVSALILFLFAFTSFRSQSSQVILSQQELAVLTEKHNAEPGDPPGNRKPLITSCINENTGEVISNGSLCVFGSNPYCVENYCVTIKKGPK
jgi:hypothetical protein